MSGGGPAFGLYPSRALLPAQRLAAGATVALHTPVEADGATLFRVSYWLPVPPVVAAAQALRLAPAGLQLRFDPAVFDVPLSDRGWFPTVETVAFQTLRIDFAWPASVTRIARPAGRDRHAVELLRADGDAVADKPTQAGVTGADLAPPWVGSPLVLRIGEVVAGLDRVMLVDGERVTVARGAPGRVSAVADKVDRLASVGGARHVGGLRLAGRPTSPRLKLLAERGATSSLLWQALLPGAQAQATLPERAVGVEWADALEQLRLSATGPDGAPERLRLDIESDAPCSVTFTTLDLGLHAETELLGAPQRLDFAGDRLQALAFALPLPAGVAPLALRLSGRVVGAAQPGASGPPRPGAQRQGAWLPTDHAAVQPLALAAPSSLVGLAFEWQPLSSALRLRARLLADAGRGRVLADVQQPFETAQAARLVLRWPAIDLQAQRLAVELTVLEGAGLWVFADADGPAGWSRAPGAQARCQPLPRALSMHALAVPAQADPAGGIALRIGNLTLAPPLAAGSFELDLPAGLLPLLAGQALVAEASVRASVMLESARLETAG